jgi:hypothetical protein
MPSLPGHSSTLALVGTNGTCDTAGAHTHALTGGDEKTTPVNVAIWYVIKGDVPERR